MVSDIVANRETPPEMQNDPELWSGCVSGALSENAFLEAFEKAGFYGIGILTRDATPWRVVEDIEFRSITVRAFKGNPAAQENANIASEDCCGNTRTRNRERKAKI